VNSPTLQEVLLQQCKVTSVPDHISSPRAKNYYMYMEQQRRFIKAWRGVILFVQTAQLTYKKFSQGDKKVKMNCI